MVSLAEWLALLGFCAACGVGIVWWVSLDPDSEE